jgi:hypothetical protein
MIPNPGELKVQYEQLENIGKLNCGDPLLYNLYDRVYLP